MSKRIVVVEDEAIMKLDIICMLEDAGFDVVGQAGDGEKAIELVDLLKPDLVIMDIKMPKLNGLKASEILAKRYQTPVLLLTAYSQREYIHLAKKANIVGYLVKPISEANLIPAVEIALLQVENARHYQGKLAELNESIQQRKIIERAKGMIMEKKHVTEDVAYQKLRKLSMNKQMSLEKVAKKIILKYSQL